MPAVGFELVCEIEPPTRPDLKHVRHQIGVLSSVAGTFLIPDNHIGRATVSSVAVAHEVEAMGGRSIACLNARDRNLLGLQRDLLTAAAYGVDQFLFVYGDEPRSGARTSELTVRTMLSEARSFERQPGSVWCDGRYVWARSPALGRSPTGSARQTSCSCRSDSHSTCCCVGTTVCSRTYRCTRESSSWPAPAWPAISPGRFPTYEIPSSLLTASIAIRTPVIEAACELLMAIRDTGAFQGVHLIPVSRATARWRPASSSCSESRRLLLAWSAANRG